MEGVEEEEEEEAEEVRGGGGATTAVVLKTRTHQQGVVGKIPKSGQPCHPKPH